MGMIKNAMAPGTEPEPDETAAHEQAEAPEMEATEDAAEAAGQEPEGDGQEAEQDPSTDPGYAEAMSVVMKAFYEDGAAREVASAIRSAKDPAVTMANLAYDAVTAVDEKTEGSIPDELIGAFASTVLSEVAEIAEAAGIKVTGKDVAVAVKTMLLRYANDNGMDTTQIQQAMDTVNTDEMGQKLETMGAE